MRNFVLRSIVALQLIQLASNTCAATRRGSRSGRGGERSELRVRFGVDDVDDRYPYVVSVQHRRRKYCTGTLITPDWVLTAAHCTLGTHIRFGNMTIKTNKTFIRKIKKFITYPRTLFVNIPPYYKYHNDIALLQIEPLHLKNYGRISGLNYRSLLGYPVEYAGFGSTWIDSDGDLIQTYEEDELRPLQLGEGVVVHCEDIHKEHFHVPNMCVAPKCSNNQQDTLPGDSGGPLFYGGKILGALCGGEKPPIGSYTPVSPYLDWIHDTVTQEKM